MSTVGSSMRYRVTGLAAEAAFFTVLSVPPLIFALAGAIGYVTQSFSPDQVDHVRTAIIDLASRFLTDSAVDRVIQPTIDDVLRGRPVRRDLGRLRAGAVVGLAGDARLRRHHHDHARARRAPGDRQDPGAVVLPLPAGDRHRRRGAAAGGGRTALVHRWLPGPGRLPGQLLLAGRARRSRSASWRRSTTCRSRCGPNWRINLPGATFALGVLAARELPAARVPHRDRRRLRSIYGPLAAPIAVLLWLYILSIAVLVGAALNAAFDTVFPQQRTTHARLELVQRLRPPDARRRRRRAPWTRFGVVPTREPTSPAHGHVVLPEPGPVAVVGAGPAAAAGARRSSLVTVMLVCVRPRRATATATTPRRTHINLVDAIYYTTVTLSTTGYGDIAPVSPARPAGQRVRDHPAAHRVPGAADRHHARGAGHPGPRACSASPAGGRHMNDHVVIVGYGTKGRSAVETLVNNGIDRDQIVVVDKGGAGRRRDAHADGLAVVTGDATRAEVLQRAGVERGQAGHHHHRPRRLQRARHPDRPAAQRRRLDRRRRCASTRTRR